MQQVIPKSCIEKVSLKVPLAGAGLSFPSSTGGVCCLLVGDQMQHCLHLGDQLSEVALHEGDTLPTGEPHGEMIGE